MSTNIMPTVYRWRPMEIGWTNECKENDTLNRVGHNPPQNPFLRSCWNHPNAVLQECREKAEVWNSCRQKIAVYYGINYVDDKLGLYNCKLVSKHPASLRLSLHKSKPRDNNKQVFKQLELNVKHCALMRVMSLNSPLFFTNYMYKWRSILMSYQETDSEQT